MYWFLILLLLIQFSHQTAFFKAILFNHHQEEDGGRLDITSSMEDNLMFAGRLAWQAVKDAMEDDRVRSLREAFKNDSEVDEKDECCFRTSNTLRVFRRFAKQLVKSGGACINRSFARIDAEAGDRHTLQSSEICKEIEAEFYRIFYPSIFNWSPGSRLAPFSFAKTLFVFPNLKNFTYEQGVACEVLLADLFVLMWPNVDGAAFESFDDLGGMFLLYVFTQPGCLYDELLDLIKKIVSDLPIPEVDELDRELALGRRDLFISSLFLYACQADLKVCFDAILKTRLLNEHAESTIKMVISSASLEMAKRFLDRIDRNCRIGLQTLAQLIFYNNRFDLFKVLMRYEDVDWNALDFYGCTLLSYFINWEDNSLDQLFVSFVMRSRCSFYCRTNKCILEETIEAEKRIGQRAMKRFYFFIENRYNDGLDQVMITAASMQRIDLFSQMLQLRLDNLHELDHVFQTIFTFLKLDEPAYEEYLQLIIECVRNKYPKRNHFAQMFLFKWTCQIALWESARPEN